MRQNEDADPFRWEDVDQRLLSPKTNDLAEEMHERASEAERRIRFDSLRSGNSAGYLPQWFDFQEQLTEEWAKRLFTAYCETWTQQNRAISAGFVRAVRDQAIAQLIAARKSSVRSGVLLSAQRTGEAPNPTALGERSRRMDRLSAHWNRRLEADAVKIEYRVNSLAQVSQDASISGMDVIANESGGAEPPETWRRFHEAFMALSAEELTFAPNNVNDRWLRASVVYEDQKTKCGQWRISAGVNEGFKTRFEVAAARGGIALRTSQLGPPLDVWLNHVSENLREHNSKLLFSPSEHAATILRVCEASAIYCARLEILALGSAKGDRPPETLIGIKAVGSKRNADSKPGPAVSRPAIFLTFAGGLWRDAMTHAEGGKVSAGQLKKIAASLDDAQYVPPARYLERSCADEVRAFNSRNSKSQIGPIQTWTRLVDIGDKDHLRGMRRLLSRCAKQQPR